jgi:branched-chain amino acid transport system substrate-binding protein
MRVRRTIACASALVLLAAMGCRLLIGSLDECKTTSDCASRGQNLICQANLCVAATLDKRCVTFGPTSGERIVIGTVFPMTISASPGAGPDPRGVVRAHAIELAFSEINPPIRVGIGNRPLELVLCDNANDSDAARALAQNLVDFGAVAIISAGTTDTLAISRVTLPARVLLMSVSATAAEIGQLPANDPAGTGVRMLWRTAPSDTFQGQVIAKELSTQSPTGLPKDGGAPPRVATLYSDLPYGQGIWAAFSGAYPADAAQPFVYTQSEDVSQALAGARAYRPDVALNVASASDMVRVVNGAQGVPELVRVAWFFPDGAKTPQLIAGVSPPGTLEGARGTAPAIATGSEAYAWLAPHLQQLYGDDPTSVSYVANSFDAAMLIAVAASWASTQGGPIDGPHLAMGLTQVSAVDGGLVVPLDPPHFNVATSQLAAGQPINVEGSSGHLDFDNSTGEAPADYEVWRIADGGFTTVKVVSP